MSNPGCALPRTGFSVNGYGSGKKVGGALQGSFVALLTPFKEQAGDPAGAVDEQAFAKLIEWQIAEGTHGLVPCGTTGESPTLSHAEHKRVVELCVEVAAKRVPVLAGAGSNCTAEAIELVRHAKAAGADAALVVTPYYNKPTQEGLYLHYKAINDAVDFPLYIYNIPGRSIIDMSVETMARLWQLPHIVGVKDASGDGTRTSKMRTLVSPDFCQLSGDDGAALSVLVHGGHGCISVTANVAPKLCAQMQVAWQQGKTAEALALHEQLLPLHTAMFVEPNPVPVKYAASLLGLARETVRLPLAPLMESTRQKVKQALQVTGILK